MLDSRGTAFKIDQGTGHGYEDLLQRMGHEQSIEFDGQQEGERVLFTFVPHSRAFWLSMLKLLVGCLVLIALKSLLIEYVLPPIDNIQYIGYGITGIVALGGIWWLNKYYREARVFVTDRRIIRFEPIFPIFKQKRILFWANVMKTKAVSTNFILRLLKIGSVVVSPVHGDSEDIRMRYVYYFEDLVNYLDKILFLSKHTPVELNTVKPFVLKPKGHRY